MDNPLKNVPCLIQAGHLTMKGQNRIGLKNMRISLIGMSNIGKTFWAKRLAVDKRLKHINCDALIEKKMEVELAQHGYHGLHDVAKWMGQPADHRYEKNSHHYIALEQIVMREALDQLRDSPDNATVIDTTGSVIYAGPEILEQLRADTRVIYFEASDAHIGHLFRRYLDNPKPVIWGDVYASINGEEAPETLKRCYPELMQERARHYSKLAHVTIPFDLHRNHATTIDALFNGDLLS
jgi:shikimate kinase